MDQPFILIYFYFCCVLFGLNVFFSILGGYVGLLPHFSLNKALHQSLSNYRLYLASVSSVLFFISTPSFYRVAFHVEEVPINYLLYSNIFFGLGLIYYLCFKYGFSPPVKSFYLTFLSLFFSTALVVGHCFYHLNTFIYAGRDIYYFVFLGLLFVGLFYFFQLLLSHFFGRLDGGVFSRLFISSQSGVNKGLQDASGLSHWKLGFGVFVFLLAAWSPYLYYFYPGVLSFDPNLSLRQFFGHPTANAAAVVLVDPQNPITNHHPYLYTLLLGTFVKVGLGFGSFNMGLFFYTIFQLTLLASAFTLGIVYLRALGASKLLLTMLTLFFGFVPIFPYYAITAYKDVFYSSFFVFFVLLLHLCVSRANFFAVRGRILFLVLFCIVGSGLVFFRHNGIYVFVSTLIAFLSLNSPNRKLVLLAFSFVVTLYIGFNHYYLQYAGVSPGPAREKYSLPFQQTARYVKYCSDVVSEEEKLAISAVFPYESLGELYDPYLADPVKSSFNFLSTSSEFSSYLGAWARGFTKKPLVYLEATVNNTFLYFYPLHIDWVVIGRPDTFLRSLGYDYDPINSGERVARRLVMLARTFIYIPIVGLVVNGAFLIWVILTFLAYWLYKRWFSQLVLFVPYLVTILFFLLSPANGHYRYFLPIVFSAPLFVCLLLFNARNFIGVRFLNFSEDSKNSKGTPI